MTRARKERWLKANDSRHPGLGFDNALAGLIERNGLGWFTDKQINELASELVGRLRDDRHSTIHQRNANVRLRAA